MDRSTTTEANERRQSEPGPEGIDGAQWLSTLTAARRVISYHVAASKEALEPIDERAATPADSSARAMTAS